MSGIFVLGMHRSGTSALARVVGILVGYEGEREAALGNETGHWETASARAVNNAIFARIGCDWACPPEQLPSAWTDSRISSLRPDAVAAIEAEKHSSWVWKDPRCTLTFPLWRQLCTTEPLIIATYRHPTGVGQSLHQRDGLPELFGVALWERYNRALVSALQGRKPLWVSFEELTEHPAAVVETVIEWLGQNGFPVTDARAAQAAEHIRARPSRAPAGAPLSVAQEQLWNALSPLHGQTAAPPSLIPDETYWLADMLTTRRRYLELESELWALRGKLRRVELLFRLTSWVRRVTGQRRAY